jgi:hypothetical protein
MRHLWYVQLPFVTVETGKAEHVTLSLTTNFTLT